MFRIAAAACATFAFLACSFCPGMEDPPRADAIPQTIREEIDKAKGRCRGAVTAARRTLSKALEREAKKAIGDRKLTGEKRLRNAERLFAEKASFEASPADFPASEAVKSEVKDYRVQCVAARKRLDEAYARAGRSLLDEKKDAAAARLVAERIAFLNKIGLEPHRRQWVGRRTEDGVESVRRLTLKEADEWIENVNDGPLEVSLMETFHSAHCIELHDSLRSLSIRLYDDHAEVKEGNAPWRPYAKGGWEKARK